MGESYPKFDAPPVIETVLSAQFPRLTNYSDAVAGWFWKSRLPSNWTRSKDAPPLDEQFERFGDERKWEMPPPFRLRRFENSTERTQLIRDDGERMIQVQDTRFILNWRREQGGYPSYKTLRPEFQQHFKSFRDFASEAVLGDVIPNQWEVTYVNHIPRGGLWESVADWPKILPGLHTPKTWGNLPLETQGGNWRFVIENRARLYVSLQHGRLTPDSEDLLVLQFTARGPVSADAGRLLDDGFDLGHEAIVKSFAAMTSPEAHTAWKRRA